jgi:hypothetical protein
MEGERLRLRQVAVARRDERRIELTIGDDRVVEVDQLCAVGQLERRDRQRQASSPRAAPA